MRDEGSPGGHGAARTTKLPLGFRAEPRDGGTGRGAVRPIKDKKTTTIQTGFTQPTNPFKIFPQNGQKCGRCRVPTKKQTN